jgi:putative ABC transport system permease protein
VSGNIAPAVMLQGLAIAIVVGVLGGAYPAYRAARLMPTVGLRHE